VLDSAGEVRGEPVVCISCESNGVLQVVEEDIVVDKCVSKAAVKSKRMRSDGEPVSAAIRRSLVTLTKAVSVLGQGRNQTEISQTDYFV
jgi:hypothetical protein